MDKNLMSKTTFSEICKILNGKDQDIKDCINGFFEVALLFLPVSMCKDVEFIVNLANGAAILDAKHAIEEGIKGIKKVFGKREYQDFFTKYDHAQIAQVLIVFAAYFDAVKGYLPDENAQIRLTDKEKYYITEQSLNDYISFLKERAKGRPEKIYGRDFSACTLWDYDLAMPNPVESFEEYLERLKGFYGILNRELQKFYEKLLCWEAKEEKDRDVFMAVFRHIPDLAVLNYKKQYYELAVSFSDFFVWSNMQEHRQIGERIDVGFKEIEKLIKSYYEANHSTKAAKTLERYTKRYQREIEKAIFDTTEMGYDSLQGVVFPAKKQVFVPQSFKSLLYGNDIKLEQESTWEEMQPREGIGKFISDTLRNPELGGFPMLILGHPGAGKSLLCYMLASQILYHEYHVIIIHLRDTIAEESIIQQINQQIERDFGNKCTWDDIADSELSKPILLIFDGYDELLQASGKTYSDYLQRIVEFQKDQKAVYDMFVKCIVTSRTTLTNRVQVTENSPIVRLCDFNLERMGIWSDIWNEQNQIYFEKNNLKPFRIHGWSKVYELAKQPLLLSMLALYDSNGNALEKQQDLSRTELYNELIREFVSREKRKDDNFRGKATEAQEEIVENEVEEIGIAAVGMYNRKRLYIRASELEEDTHYIKQTSKNAETVGAELKQSEKRLAGFFFVHRSAATEIIEDRKVKCSAYEFLHNTFGEFLTANYIVSETYKVLLGILRDGQVQWDLRKQRAWCAGISYAPLFTRPVIVKMIHEWSYSYMKNKRFNDADFQDAMEFLVNTEIQRVISGEAVFSIGAIVNEKENPFAKQDILKHLAVYSVNLIILRVILCGESYLFEYEKFADKQIWEKLLALWKQVFSEDELLALSQVLLVKKTEQDCFAVWQPEWMGVESALDRINNLYDISYSLGDHVMFAQIAALAGSDNLEETLDIMKQERLEIKANYWWNVILKNIGDGEIRKNGSMLEMLAEFKKSCWSEENAEYIFAYYLLLNYLLRAGELKLNAGQRNQLILENIVPTPQELRGYAILGYGSKKKFAHFRTLILELVEFLTIDAYCIRRIFEGPFQAVDEYPQEVYTNRFVLKICNKVLSKAIQSGKVKRLLEEVLFPMGMEWFVDILVWKSRPSRMTQSWLNDVLQFSYNLAVFQEWEFSFRILIEAVQIAFRSAERRKVTNEQRCLIMKWLYVMYPAFADDVRYEDYAWIFRIVVEDISLWKVYEECPETLEYLCYLLENIGFANRKEQLMQNLRMFAKSQKEKLSIQLYKAMRKLAEKEGDEELLKILAAIIE